MNLNSIYLKGSKERYETHIFEEKEEKTVSFGFCDIWIEFCCCICFKIFDFAFLFSKGPLNIYYFNNLFGFRIAFNIYANVKKYVFYSIYSAYLW